MKRKKFKGLKGYRLHAKRIESTGKSGAVRTIKYPLHHPDFSIIHRVADAIRSDYLSLYGPSNLDDFYRIEKGHKDFYSVIDFWFDCLRFGGVFASKSSELVALLEKLDGVESSDLYRLERSKKKLNVQVASEVLMSSSRSTSTPNSRYKKFIGCFLEPTPKDEKDCRELAENILQSKDQRRDLEVLFGIDEIVAPKMEKRENLLNLTFCLYPFLSINDGSKEPAELLEERLQECGVDVGDLGPLGLENSGNALQNFLNAFLHDLQDGQIEKLMEAMLKMTSAWDAKKADLASRLQYLSERAKELKQPFFGASWADYRHEINGKIVGWFKNYLNQKVKIAADLEKGHRNDLKKAMELLQKARAGGEKYQALSADIENLQEILDKIQSNGPDYAYVATYTLLLGGIKPQLNSLLQTSSVQELLISETNGKKSKKKTESEGITFDEYFPSLSKPVKQVPNFYGGSKRKLWNTYKQSAVITEKLWNMVDQIYKSLFAADFLPDVPSSFSFQKKLQQVFNVYQRQNTEKFMSCFEKALEQYADIAEMKKRNYDGEVTSVFYKSPYARGRNIEVVNVQVPVQPFEAIIAVVKSLAASGFKWKDLTHEERIDLIELHKVAVALLFSVKDVFFDIRKFDVGDLEVFHNFVKTVGENVIKGRLLERFLQNVVFAELRGLSAYMSREIFLSRSAIQTLNGGQARLLYVIKNGMEESARFIRDVTEKKHDEKVGQRLRNNPHFFAYTLSMPKNEYDKPALVFEKSKKEQPKPLQFKAFQIKKETVLEVRSSYYQIQFLEWFLHSPSKVDTEVTLDGSFLIEERFVKAKWDMNTLSIHLEDADNEVRVFCSQPFTFIPKHKKSQQALNVFMGVDIGEYGLGYTVLEVVGNTVKIFERGFIHEPRLKLLREEVKRLKQTQKRGTFTMAQTKIALLRDDVANSLRNRVHAIALQYKAEIVYEWQVSAFEAGGKKIEKLYATIKKPDVYSQADVDQSMKKALWGDYRLKKEERRIAEEVSARGSSQFCSSCKRWWRNEIDEGNDSFVITDWKHSLAEISVFTKDGKEKMKLYGYAEDKPKNMNISYSQVRRYVGDFMRPPRLNKKGYLSAVFERFVGSKVSEEFVKMRGNSAVYICPVVHGKGKPHVSDADIQASQTLALLGYVKNHYSDLKDQKERYLKIADLQFESVVL